MFKLIDQSDGLHWLLYLHSVLAMMPFLVFFPSLGVHLDVWFALTVRRKPTFNLGKRLEGQIPYNMSVSSPVVW